MLRKKITDNSKISIIIGNLAGGGAERVACNLANYLNYKTYDVDVVVFSEQKNSYKLDNGIHKVVLLKNHEKRNRIHNIFLRQKRFKQYVKNNNAMCYIALMPKNAFRITLLKKYTKGKIIISERNYPARHCFTEKIMMKYASKKCDGLVAQTNEIGKWYKNVNEVAIIPNAANKDIFVERKGPIVNKFVAVGKLKKQKNYYMLISAFNLFSKEYPNYCLEIYGEGEQKEELEKLVDNYGIKSKVRFMGYTLDVYERIANAKCFLMTSNYEGIPNALIEAMCIGLPCIATDCDGGGIKTLIKNEENGLLIEKGAVEKFAIAMKRIIKDDALRNAISKNAKKIGEELDSDRIYKEWLDFIIKVCGRCSTIDKMCQKGDDDV